MGFTHDLAVDVLRSIPQYQAAFKNVYGDDGIKFDDVTNAIAAFEETLVTPNAPFDRWLLGDKKPSAPRQRRATSCSRASAAWPVITARRSVAAPSRKWAWSNPTPPKIRPRAWRA